MKVHFSPRLQTGRESAVNQLGRTSFEGLDGNTSVPPTQEIEFTARLSSHVADIPS